MKTQMWDINRVVPYARNPRKNDAAVDKVAASLKEFGWRQPIVVDGEGVIIAGHTRYKAARQLGMDKVPVHVADNLTPAQIKAYRIADNKVGELAEWDMELLALEIEDLKLDDYPIDLTGFDVGELPGYEEPEPQDAEPQIDRAEELRKEWGVESGQLWELGDHRLLCGDSTNADDVARVMDVSCSAVVFDPEWDRADAFDAAPYQNVLAFTDGQRCGDLISMFGAPAWVFVWDCVSSWYTPSRPLKRGKLCLWFGDVSRYEFDGAHYGSAGEQREVYNTRGSYTFKPDKRGKHLSDVFSHPITKLHADSEHSHSKPVDWVRLLVGNCTAGSVYDPYCGSGTTLIACEQLGRKCRAIEISPAYVAVALQRFKDATGKTPILLDNGKPK